MDCRLCQIEIEEIEGSERLTSEAAAHLSACAECRAVYSERQSLNDLISDLEPVFAPADFDFRLRARLAASGRHERSSWRSFFFSAPAFGLAASLIVLGVAATAIYKRTTPQPQAVKVAGQRIEQPRQIQTVSSRVENAGTQDVTPSVVEKKGKKSVPQSASKIGRQQRLAGGRSVGQRRNQTPAPQFTEPGFSNELAGRTAPVITPYGGTSAPIVGASPLMEVSVRSKSQPLTIPLDERGGVKRRLTLEPVVFGSQDLTGREPSRVLASNGIW